MYFKSFLIFIGVFSTFNILLMKLGFRDKVFKRSIEVKYYNLYLVLIFFVFMIALEAGRDYLTNIYGKHNIFNGAYAGLLGAIYINLVPYIFRKKSV